MPEITTMVLVCGSIWHELPMPAHKLPKAKFHIKFNDDTNGAGMDMCPKCTKRLIGSMLRTNLTSVTIKRLEQ